MNSAASSTVLAALSPTPGPPPGPGGHRSVLSAPRSAARTVGRAGLGAAGAGWRAGQEVASLAAHAALYPAGIIAAETHPRDPRTRLDPLPPLTRGLLLSDVQAAGTPVILIHGIVDNRSAFTLMQRTLARRGHGRVLTLNYPPLTCDVTAAAARLGRYIERVCDSSGYDTVNIIGHSLGGIIARYYIQRRGGDRRVDSLVTLGAPHNGTHWARLVPLPVTRQLRPGSAVMKELAAPTRCRTRITSVWSDWDELVVPASSGRLEHADLDVTNVLIHGRGHLALLVDSAAVAACLTGLRPQETVISGTSPAADATG